ncbi:endo-1,4-beta-xylanase [Clostridium saudiense]|uniref:endo-1,4-beta-xylanase n=1 Tax=Clostridium saudiense TaxID=1414720 RepID=UPI00319E797D
MKKIKFMSVLLSGLIILNPLSSLTVEANEINKEVVFYDFEDGNKGNWYNSGDGKVEIITDNPISGDYSLECSERTQGWNGATLDLKGLLEEGKVYDISFKIRAKNEGANSVNVTVYRQYNVLDESGKITGKKEEYYDNYIGGWLDGQNIVDVQINSNEAIELKGAYKLEDSSEDKELTALNIKIESNNINLSYILDDFVVSEKGTSDSEGDGQTTDEVKFNFESENHEFSGRINSKVEIVEEAYEGNCSLKVSNRTETFDGPIINMTNYLEEGETYKLSTWVKYNDGPNKKAFKLQFSNEFTDKDTQYETIAEKSVKKGEWTLIEGEYTIPNSENLKSYSFYMETSYKETADSDPESADYDLMDFYIDEVKFAKIEKPDNKHEANIKSLHETLSDSLGEEFVLGVAVTPQQLQEGSEYEALISKHFNAIVAENVMKVEPMRPSEDMYYWDDADKVVNYAYENDMLMRGHALVWHSQMPSWFFKESEDSSKEVSSEGLLERMKEHITTVASRYAGKVYAWDVVNEVMADGISENGLRRDNENSKWARIIGDLDGDGDDDDYIEAAFRAAREADPNAKLIINEYGAESAGRKQDALYNLIERLLIAGVPVDGVGLQMHISMYNPDVKSIEATIERFAELKKYNPDFTVQVTELDVSIYKSDSDGEITITPEILLEQAYRYQELFDLFKEQTVKGNIDMTLVWGVTDNDSWLNNFPVKGRKNAPLLFDTNFKSKPAYWALVEPSSIAVKTKGIEAKKVEEVNDLAWKLSNSIEVNKRIEGKEDTKANVKVVWDKENIHINANITDTSINDNDSIEFYVGNSEAITVKRTSENEKVDESGYNVTLAIPLGDNEIEIEDTISFEVRINNYYGDNLKSVSVWNDINGGEIKEEEFGEIIFKPTSKITNAVEGLPEIDGEIDDTWNNAEVINVNNFSVGKGGAIAEVRTLWNGKYLYVLAEVTDDILNSDSSYDHEKDSIELFVDLNNAKTQFYDEDDAQYRINYKNETSFNGSCDTDNFDSATQIVDGGYIVEVAICVGENKENSLIGFDVQVNDADATGKRVAVANWCDMSGLGWQKSINYGNIILNKNDDVEIPSEDNTVPEIIANDIILNLGDEFNPYSIVKANDKEDGDITDKIKVVENTVDTKRIGDYKVIYSVEDSMGESVTKEIKVSVINKNSTGNNNNINKLPQTGNENLMYMMIISILFILIGIKIRYNKVIK